MTRACYGGNEQKNRQCCGWRLIGVSNLVAVVRLCGFNHVFASSHVPVTVLIVSRLCVYRRKAHRAFGWLAGLNRSNPWHGRRRSRANRLPNRLGACCGARYVRCLSLSSVPHGVAVQPFSFSVPARLAV